MSDKSTAAPTGQDSDPDDRAAHIIAAIVDDLKSEGPVADAVRLAVSRPEKNRVPPEAAQATEALAAHAAEVDSAPGVIPKAVVSNLDIDMVIRDAVEALGKGKAAPDCLAAFAREHALTNEEVLVLIVQAVDVVNRRQGSAAS